MVATWQELGGRIATVRQRAGLSTADLAAAAQLAPREVSDIEAGCRSIEVLELVRIAQALDRPIYWLMGTPPPAAISRRNALQAPTAAADDQLEILAQDVELLVELGVLNPVRVSPPSFAINDVRTAERAATEARRIVGVSTGPVWDLVEIAERMGLYAFSLQIEPQTWDGSYLALQQGGVALIQGHAHSGRRRFTLAHELGHHFLADQYSAEWIVGTPASERERLIDAFAIHFLLPRESVSARWKQLEDEHDARNAAILLAAEFGVSWTALCNHLNNLGLIDETTRHNLMLLTPRRDDYLELGLTVREDLAPLSLPPGYTKAVIKAYRSYKIGESRALELLRGTLPPEELSPPPELSLDAMMPELLPLP